MDQTEQMNSLNDLQRQNNLEFALNARTGLLTQMLGWLLLVFVSGFYDKDPVLSLTLTWIMLVICLLGITHHALHQYFYRKSMRLWMATYYLLLLLNGLFWSGFYVYLISFNALSPELLATTLIVSLLTSVAVYNMRAKLVVPQLYFALLFLPAALMCLTQNNLQFLGALLFAYWLGIVLLSLWHHKQYQDNLRFQLNLIKNKQGVDLKDKIDSLTKIYNRHYFEDSFEYQWQLAIRTGTEIALLMIEIDDFKTVNQLHGQHHGDQCLVQIADIIRQSVKRQTDMVIRYADEQFVLILPDTEQAAATNLAELIRQNIEFANIAWGNENHSFTASIGVGVVRPKQYSSPTLLLQKAEMALFQAKNQGHNRVELA